MSYASHEWQTGETITAAKLNNIEEGIQEAAQSSVGITIDAIFWFPNSTLGWQVEGNFADTVAKLQDGKPPFIFIVEDVYMSSGEVVFGSYTPAFAVQYLEEYPNRINVAFNSFSGLEWTENSIEYYNND